MPLRRSRWAGKASREAGAGRGASPAAAHSAAVALLARRDHASAELRERLAGQGFEPRAVAEALAALAAQGTLDDARYAQNYVAYHAARGRGPIRIGAELRARGLPPELIEGALGGGPDWPALARDLRARHFGRAAPGSWREKARQARFLQYRGFSSDHIRAATGAAPDLD
jgi:regulatory protein